MEKNEANYRENEEKQLTDRELEVLRHLTMGKTNAQIGEELGLSAHTVKAHVGSIMRKMSVEARVQAAVKAVKSGLID